MITVDTTTTSFRGTPAEISALEDSLRTDGSDAPASILGAAAPGLAEDPALAPIAEALRSPLFSVTLTVSGPGGQQEHRISVGANGTGVRRSPVREGVAELAGFAIGTLPGGITRLVRFRPGSVPAPDPAAVPVPAAALLDLTDPDSGVRRRSWGAAVGPALLRALGDPVDDSWQIVEARSAWTSPDGSPAEDLAVHLRRGDDHLEVREEGEEPVLVHVTSLRVWESLLGILPEQHDIAAPS